jgi:hypothetical protein
MEFMNRGNHPGQPLNTPAPAAAPSNSRGGRGKGLGNFQGLRIASVALLFSATVLVVALVWYLVLGGPSNEAKYIEKDKMQAVFLNGGQVYFGKIKDLNDQYLRMSDIFYLRVNQVVQPNQEGNQQQAAQNDISLVKLGCELHRPSNEMLINREQIIFWENLKDESGENTVPGAVKKYLAQYPNGQECQDQAQQQQSDNSGQNNNQDNSQQGNSLNNNQAN